MSIDPQNHSLVIRPVEPGDRPHWQRLWQAYLAFYETELPDQVYDTTFARLHDGDPMQVKGMIALLDERPVGLVHYFLHAHAWRIEKVCYLQDLYTDARARGQGVGRALIQAVYGRADELGAPNVYWTTQDYNHTARRLYDDIGTKTPFIKYIRG